MHSNKRVVEDPRCPKRQCEPSLLIAPKRIWGLIAIVLFGFVGFCFFFSFFFFRFVPFSMYVRPVKGPHAHFKVRCL